MDTVVSVRTSSAAPVRVGGVTVTPLARALAVRLPFGAGFVWNRPRAVLVEREGRVERMRVVDVTRAVQLGILVSTVVAVAAIAVLSRRKE